MRKCIVGTVVSCWLMALPACKSTSPNGNAILSRDTMKVVLWEMFEADAYNETRAVTDTNFRHDTAFASLYTDIFKAHHITRAEFADSYDYYMARPEVLRAMIDTMADKANRDMMKGGPPPINRGPAGPFTPAVRPGGPMGPNGRPGGPVGPNGRPVGPMGPNGHPTPYQVMPGAMGKPGAPPTGAMGRPGAPPKPGMPPPGKPGGPPPGQHPPGQPGKPGQHPPGQPGQHPPVKPGGPPPPGAKPGMPPPKKPSSLE